MKNQFAKKIEKPILRPRGFPYLYFKGNWEARWVYHAKVISHNKKFLMFYSGKSGINRITNFKFQMRQDIGFAESKDLKIWKRYNQNPVFTPTGENSWDNDFVCHSFILKNDNKFYLFYDGSKVGVWRESIGVAQSNDLIHWERKLLSPVLSPGSFWWDRKHVSRSCVIKDNDNFYMFFAGHDGIRERIGIARSKNLRNWKKISSEPILDLGLPGEWDDRFISDPRILRVKNYYLMTYTGYKGVKACVGLAYSRDLLKWKKFSLNPILDHGQAGSWDEDEAARADFVKINNDYFLFYTGMKSFFYRIGMAILDMKAIFKVIQNVN